MGNIAHRRHHATFAATLLAIVCGVFAPTARAEEDSAAREFSVFAGNTGPAPMVDAVTREITVFAGTPGPFAMDDAASREFTVFSGDLEPKPVADSTAREFTVLVIEPPDFAITDAIAREFVVHVPAAPLIILAASPLTYTEADGAVAIDPLATISDPDTTDFGGGELRVELVEGAAPGDTLDIGHPDSDAAIHIEADRILHLDVEIATFTGGGALPLSVAFHPGTGIESVAAVVRHVRFSNAQRFPDAGARIAEFRLSDVEVGFGLPSTREIIVVPVNQPPIAGRDFIGVEMDMPMDLPESLLLSNDSDADGDAITLTLPATATAAGGSIAPNNGNLTYTPLTGFTGTDHFDYQISDPFGGLTTGRVTLFVRAADDSSCSVLNMTFDEESGAFTLEAIGLPGRTYDLLASETLDDWLPAAFALSNAYGKLTVVDPDAPFHPKRFYKFDFHLSE